MVGRWIITRSRIIIGFGIAIALQFFILTGMVVKAAMPLWTGTEVRIKTVPVDPRSLFRGNYARLNYEISQLKAEFLQSDRALRIGEVVYVRLTAGDDQLYTLTSASLDKPDSGVFLRGRLTSAHPPYRIKYGIEAFFAPKQKALKLEDDLRQGGIAILMVTESGDVALKDVVPNSPAK